MRRFPRPCTGPERAHGGGSRLPRLAHLEDEMDAGSDPRQIAAIFDRARGDYIAPLLWAKYVAFLTEREADAEASPSPALPPFSPPFPCRWRTRTRLCPAMLMVRLGAGDAGAVRRGSRGTRVAPCGRPLLGRLCRVRAEARHC